MLSWQAPRFQVRERELATAECVSYLLAVLTPPPTPAPATLSEWYTDLCHLDTTHVGRCLSWLCDGIGLSRRQAGALLASDLQLLVGSESDLEFRQAWVQLELLGHAAGVAHRPLAAALCLAQPARQLTALTADLTRRLAALLRVS